MANNLGKWLHPKKGDKPMLKGKSDAVQHLNKKALMARGATELEAVRGALKSAGKAMGKKIGKQVAKHVTGKPFGKSDSGVVGGIDVNGTV